MNSRVSVIRGEVREVMSSIIVLIPSLKPILMHVRCYICYCCYNISSEYNIIYKYNLIGLDAVIEVHETYLLSIQHQSFGQAGE